MKALIFLALAIFIAGGIYWWADDESRDRSRMAGDSQQSDILTQRNGAPDRSPASVALVPPAPLAPGERAAVSTLLGLFHRANRVRHTEELLDSLRAAGLQPRVTEDENEDTGKMTVVRSENALPGTRYFHAQVFTDEKGQSHVQHQSFEIRPGPDSLRQALSLIRQNFPGLGRPVVQEEGYALWKTRDGRVISAKQLGPEDLEDNYYNAHTIEDVGTVWVIQEDDPHAHDAGDHL
jgi:hypothetical protein